MLLGVAQLVFKRQPLGGALVHVAGVAFETGAAVALRALHRGFGVALQRRRVLAIQRVHADADAEA